MAKKGGVQQLQAEINTDDEFDKFMERSGVLVMDVYTEWCGPCLGMVGSLKKIKLELGGDNLQLAICRSDTIECLKRFRNKSEPTWLFGSSRKIINLMFGTNVPKLIRLITEELSIEEKVRNEKFERKYYELDELTPEEQVRENARIALEEEQARLEKEFVEKERNDYLTFVTSEIMHSMLDMGITLVMPHLAKERDLPKKLTDPADKFELVTKERKLIQILPEELEILYFEIENPFPDFVLEYLHGKEIMAIAWKKGDTDLRPVEEVMSLFVDICTKEQEILDEAGNPDPELKKPALFKPLDVPIPIGEIHEQYLEPEIKLKPVLEEPEEKAKIDEETENEISGSDETAGENNEANIEEEKASIKESVKSETKSDDSSKYFKQPAIWTPANSRATAAFIYTYFRNLTDHFLPPDPIPDPPHIALAFDAVKKRDIIDALQLHPDSVLAWGYFTTADPYTAKLIASTTREYLKIKPTIEDKFIIKVAKQTSNVLLALTGLGPCYLSRNTITGKEECSIIFPKGYRCDEEERQEEAAEEITKKKKGRKKKKGKTEDQESNENVEKVTEEMGLDEEIGDEDDNESEVDKQASPEDSIERSGDDLITELATEEQT